MRIRPETDTDRSAVRAVNEAAFGTPVEANLIDALRGNSPELISLVADSDDVVVGHILFSRVTLEGYPRLRLMGLGPMAVSPQHQRNGIGSALVREGLVRCKQLPIQAVVVLGHPEYYPRFGFVPAHRYAIRCEYDVPDDVFMIAELEPGALDGVSGLLRYDPAFAGV
jgi:putative acetyltransferase